MEKIKNIVIFDTAVCTSNLGDEIILNSIYENIGERIFDKYFNIRLGTHVSNFLPLQYLKPDGKLKYARNADVKFICGTNLLQQNMFCKINPQWQLHIFNRDIYTNSVLIGFGARDSSDSFDFYSKYLYKNILSKKYYHSVRDEKTKHLIESLGLKAINTGCPTLWKFTPDFCKQIPKEKADGCVVSLSGYKNQQDRINDQLLLDIIKRNYHSLYIWIQTNEDEQYFDSFDSGNSFKKIFTLANYKKILQEEKVNYVGTRLHGGVFALQNKCRSLIISIDHRAIGFAESNNLPILNRTEIRDRLESKINSNWDTNIKIDEQAIEKFVAQFDNRD